MGGPIRFETEDGTNISFTEGIDGDHTLVLPDGSRAQVGVVDHKKGGKAGYYVHAACSMLIGDIRPTETKVRHGVTITHEE